MDAEATLTTTRRSGVDARLRLEFPSSIRFGALVTLRFDMAFGANASSRKAWADVLAIDHWLALELPRWLSAWLSGWAQGRR